MASKAEGPPRNSHDYVLCRFDEDMFAELSGLIDPVALETELHSGSEIFMTGTGCTFGWLASDSWQFSGFDGQLRGDFASVVVPREGSGQYFTTEGNPSFSRAHAESGPALCKGDSGGPVYRIAEVNGAVVRNIIGVNSSVGAKERWDEEPNAGTRSLQFRLISRMSALHYGGFSEYLAEWSSRHPDALICGVQLQPGEGPCRQPGSISTINVDDSLDGIFADDQ
ncbi:MAG: trypsin-like serine protease [Cyanobacteria bacterium J06648_11]